MRSPTLGDLPSPPEGKTGWPWTEETPQLPDVMPDGSPWPKISIVTPNYNYGRFIERTIRSVLLQGYANLEYIIIDGGSTDNSVKIIKKYEKWLAYWTTEMDRGQANAINKGFAKSSGEIFNWLNSDDQLLPEVLFEIAIAWNKNHPHFLIGRSLTIDESSGRILYYWQPKIPKSLVCLIKLGQLKVGIAQPSNFLSSSIFRDMGYLREDLEYSFDWAFYLKAITILRSRLKIATIPIIISHFLIHPECKSVKYFHLFEKEGISILQDMRSYFFWIERLRIYWHLREHKLQKIFFKVLDNDEGRLWQLIYLLFRYPYASLSRSFWSAMKKVLMSRSNK